LAIDATNEVNGALKFLPGSHQEKRVWPHVPLGKNREDSHAIAIDFDEAAHPGVVMAKLGRGDVSIHNEYIVHGSGGNLSKGHRRTYVLAFRTEETIALERRAGFTHSHNDKTNWDTFREWQSGDADAKAKQLA
jgi:ectoine hydroxylase-related dioxygenase (phytanoyl-CoA dioxygenase family)